MGSALSLKLQELFAKRSDSKFKENINSVFESVLKSLKDDSINFMCRLNNTVSFNLPDSNQLIYYIDKRELFIFNSSECLYTSSVIDDRIKDEIIKTIWSKYSNKINDVVQVYNFTYDRDSFLRLSDNKKENDLYEDEQDLDLDSILDKINEVGYDNLDESEKEFLKNFKS